MRGVIESMTGARFVRDTLKGLGWEVLIADAQKVKGWRRWRARPTASTRRSSPCSRTATWSLQSGSDPHVRAEREQARFRLHLVKHRSMLKVDHQH